MNKLIEYLDEEIKALSIDLRAEAILADMIQHQELELEKVLIQNIGLRRRPYSKDIDAAIPTDEGNFDLVLRTNREGIYDALPEALFHKPFQSKNFKNKEDVLSEIKVHREEERQARKFFTPFENELNQLRVNIEINERKSLDVFNNKSVVSIFYKLWGGAVLNLTQEQLSILFILLPHIDQIKANPELMSFCYSKLLNDNIQVKVLSINQHLSTDNQSEDILGSDFTAGTFIESHIRIYSVYVSLSAATTIEEYMPEGIKHKMLNFFNDYFVPYDSDSEIVILNSATEKDTKTLFVPGNSFLGANTYI